MFPDWDDPELKHTRRRFIERVCTLIPSLCYLALGWRQPLQELSHLIAVDDPIHTHQPWKWWRVVRDTEGSPTKVKEIPAWEGKRVRKYLRDADTEAAREFDGECLVTRQRPLADGVPQRGSSHCGDAAGYPS